MEFTDSLSTFSCNSLCSRSNSQSKPSDHIATADEYFVDVILNRHARKLLTSMRLRDLGLFAAYLDFKLHPWLTKERLVANIITSQCNNAIETDAFCLVWPFFILCVCTHVFKYAWRHIFLVFWLHRYSLLFRLLFRHLHLEITHNYLHEVCQSSVIHTTALYSKHGNEFYPAWPTVGHHGIRRHTCEASS